MTEGQRMLSSVSTSPRARASRGKSSSTLSSVFITNLDGERSSQEGTSGGVVEFDILCGGAAPGGGPCEAQDNLVDHRLVSLLHRSL